MPAMPSTLEESHDRFGLVRVAIDASNVEDALAASGSIPIVSAPVATSRERRRATTGTAD